MIQIIKHREKTMSSFNLKKRTVIITGASGGFGSELTKILINDYDCRVIGIGKTKEKLQALADSLEGGKNKFKYYVFDVSERENWRKFADKLTESCVIPDLLINNAGIMPPFEKFEDEDGELAKRVIDVNFMSVVYGCEAMIPLLKTGFIPPDDNSQTQIYLSLPPGSTLAQTTAAARRVAVTAHDASAGEAEIRCGSWGMIGTTSVCIRETTMPQKPNAPFRTSWETRWSRVATSSSRMPAMSASSDT